MRPEHRKYIEEHAGKKSPREIASTLGMRERNVQKYLKSRGLDERRGLLRGSAAIVRADGPLPATRPWGHIIFIALIIGLTLFAYHNALRGDFIWDDEFLVRDNPTITNLANIPKMFTTYLAKASGNINNFYRPVQEMTYALDYSLWKRSPFGFHLTNVILHALCAALVYCLTFKVMKNAVAAFAAGALFGVHPINTEAVTYVAGRADSLYLLFFLTAFIFFVTAAESAAKGRRLAASACALTAALAYAVALLSKEMAIILPLFLILYVAASYPPGRLRGRLYWLAAPLGLVAAAYAVLRKTALDFSGLAPSFVMGQFNLYTRLLTTCKAVAVYLGLLILPMGLHMERKIPIGRSLGDPTVFLALILVLAIFAVAVLSYCRSGRLFFAITWFIVGLVPVSNIVPINSFIAEHWLYLPAIGVFMAAGLGISKLCSGVQLGNYGRFIGWSVLVVLLLAYSFATISRNKDWKDEVSFFNNTLKYSPGNSRLHLNFGNTYVELKQPDNALREYKIALEINPNYAEAYGNMGAVYYGKGDFLQAKKYIEKALAIKPDFPNARRTMQAILERESPGRL